MFLPYRLLAKSLQSVDLWKQFLDYQKALVKQVNNLLRISFIEECRKADIIPRFLRFRVPNNGCFEPTTVHNFQLRLLKQELNKAVSTKTLHTQTVGEKRTALKNNLPPKLIPSVILFSRIKTTETKNQVSKTHSEKLKNLSRQQERPLFEVHDTVKFIDVDHTPPQYVLDTLALGPNNSILDKFKPKEMLAELDLLLKNCENDNVSFETINDINAATMKYIKECSRQKSPRNLMMTKKYLTEYKLVAVPFDKGIGFCVMKADSYHHKLNEILQLDQFKKEVNPRKNSRDLILREEERINDELQRLHDNGKITDELLRQLHSRGGQPPRLYGLAKVHKSSVPVRPVLSMPGSPYDKLGTIVTKWLSVIPCSQIRCTNKDVVDKIKEMTLGDDEVIVSFDVSSLYTNVPVDEAIHEAANLLYSGNLDRPPVDKETFIKLLELSCKDVVMLTHDGYYRQTDGLAMGAKPAPPLANIWLSKYEPEIRDSARLFERYMDDVIRDIKIAAIESTLHRINQLHPQLKFTIERENDGRLPFLDMEIIHVGNRLSSTWYVKPTDTGLIMNYYALAPKRYKKSVVQSFVHRIHRCCSSKENMMLSLERAKETLEKNQYPSSFFNPIIQETLRKIETTAAEHNSTTTPQQQAPDNEPSTPKHMLKVQYRGSATDKYVKTLFEVKAPVIPVITIRKIRTFVSTFKSKIPDDIVSRVVYRIECPSCQACYVGQTDRHVRTRFGEHKTKRNEPVRKHFEPCAGRKAMFSDMSILHRTTNSVAFLETLEAIYIREVKPTLNTRDEWRSRELTILF